MGRVSEDPREDVRVGVGVGVVECQLKRRKEASWSSILTNMTRRYRVKVSDVIHKPQLHRKLCIGRPSHGHGNTHRNIYEAGTRGFRDMRKDRQTDKQTDTLITILRNYFCPTEK